jgi:three-Cys-motif partner protein
MSRKDFHNHFDKGTKTKLYIFNEYFKESFPVFLHSPYWKEILIYDFFAGKGYDGTGEKGTSLNILEQIKPYCSILAAKGKKLYVILNDRDEKDDLSKNVHQFLNDCQKSCNLTCIFSDKNLKVSGNDFNKYFDEVYSKILSRKNSARLIFLDPFNFILDEGRFQKLINLKTTDFMCFLPSSYLYRFRDLEVFNRYIDTKKIDYDNTQPAHCHRVIADYFQTLIPFDKEYYIGSFSIKKGSNYYGLIFGSNHSLGAEKFQKVCWSVDTLTGEADYNIDREMCYNNPTGTLFSEFNIPQKIRIFRESLEELILNRKILTDNEAFKFALKERCQIRHASDVLKKLIDEKKIKPVKLILQDIHKNKPNKIQVI